MAEREAFVSLATNDYYCRGALTLGHSIRKTYTTRKLCLLITNSVTPDMRRRLTQVWDELVVVEELDSGDAEHLALLSRPELGVTFSKLHAWRLKQYNKCVFLDADTLILQNVDELFDREELSAAPDIGWPDCFNSGVFVFVPSEETFSNLVALATQTGSFDGGDQGLLNMFWSDWATKDIKYHLPFIYNVTPNVAYGYTPAYLQFLSNVKIVHFIGPVKPWQHHYIPENGAVVLSPGTAGSQQGAYDFIKRWWEVWNSLEQPQLGGVDWRSPPPPTTHQSHHHTHSSHHHNGHTSQSHPSQSLHNSASHSIVYVPHPLSVGHYDLPQDTYFVDSFPTHPHTPPPSHLPPPVTAAHLNPVTSPFHNLMSVPYADHHAHLSLSHYSNSSNFGASGPIEEKFYNFDTDVAGNQIGLRRKLSFPYFYSPVMSRSSSFTSPVLNSHLHSENVTFPLSLTNHEDSGLSSSDSNHSLDLGCTGNDDTIMFMGSRDNHVIELPELRQPTVRISDSVLPYFKMPFSPSPSTHTTPSQITPLTDTAVNDVVPQEMGVAEGDQRHTSPAEEQHRLDFQNGRIDYAGSDSFENIQRLLDSQLVEEEVEVKVVLTGEGVELTREEVELTGEGEVLVEEESITVTVESSEAGDA